MQKELLYPIFFLLLGAIIYIYMVPEDNTVTISFPDIPFAESNNAYISHVALTVPENVEDPYQYALSLVKSGKKHFNPISTEDICPKSIYFEGDYDALKCMLSDSYDEAERCYSEEILYETIKANATLLKRYQSLISQDTWEDPPYYNCTNSHILIAADSLSLATIRYKIKQGQIEDAFKDWYKQTSFWQKAIQGEQGFRNKSMLMVLLRRNLDFIPLMLKDAPALGRLFDHEYHKILGFFDHPSGDIYNYLETITKEKQAATLLAIYSEAQHSRNEDIRVLNKEQALRDITTFAKDGSEVLAANGLESWRLYRRFEEKYKSMLEESPSSEEWLMKHSNINSMYTKSIYNTYGLYSSVLMHRMYANLLQAVVEIYAKSVPRKSVGSYLKNLSSEYRDPYSRQPFQYDSITECVYFTDPRDDRFRITACL